MQTAEAARSTVADYLQSPDEGPRYELIEGEQLMAPAPNLFHRRISFNLTSFLAILLRRSALEKFS